jgi:hypothetical protein
MIQPAESSARKPRQSQADRILYNLGTPRAGKVLAGNSSEDTSVWKAQQLLKGAAQVMAAYTAEQRPVFNLLCE